MLMSHILTVQGLAPDVCSLATVTANVSADLEDDEAVQPPSHYIYEGATRLYKHSVKMLA